MKRTDPDQFFAALARGPQTYASEDYHVVTAQRPEDMDLEGLVLRESIWDGDIPRSNTKLLGVIVFQGESRRYFLPVQQLRLRVILDITYDVNGVPETDLRRLVEDGIQAMIGDGGLTAATEAEVDEWNICTVKVP